MRLIAINRLIAHTL